MKSGLDHKILSEEEERELAIRIEAGDMEAREEFILHNLRLVFSVAKQLGLDRGDSSSLELEDIIQQGYYGLIRAVDLYDRTKARFSTYARYWIRAEILELFDNENRTYDVGLQTSRALDKLRKVELEFLQDLHRPATYQELLEHPQVATIGKRIGKTPEELLEMRHLDNIPIRLDSSISPDSSEEFGSHSLLDLVPDTRNEQPDVAVTRADTLDYLFSKLNCKERRIIKLYFGIGEEKPRTLKQISELLNINERRVQQIKSSVLLTLKEIAQTDPEFKELVFD